MSWFGRCHWYGKRTTLHISSIFIFVCGPSHWKIIPADESLKHQPEPEGTCTWYSPSAEQNNLLKIHRIIIFNFYHETTAWHFDLHEIAATLRIIPMTCWQQTFATDIGTGQGGQSFSQGRDAHHPAGYREIQLLLPHRWCQLSVSACHATGFVLSVDVHQGVESWLGNPHGQLYQSVSSET